MRAGLDTWRRLPALSIRLAACGLLVASLVWADQAAIDEPEQNGTGSTEEGPGAAALREAAQNGDVARVVGLIESGADPETALSAAAEAGQIEALRELVERVPDIGGLNPARALLHAKRAGQEGAVDLLRAAGASLDGQDVLGRTLLHNAARRGNVGMLENLIEAGADIERATRTGRTPLMVAVERGERRGLKTLMAAGANVDVSDRDGWTPLMMAVRKADRGAVRLLLEAGADPNAVSRLGWSALMLAARDGEVFIVGLLAGAGADVNLSAASTHSALVQAVIGRRLPAARELLIYGADPAMRVGGRSAIDWARAVGRRGMIELLVHTERKQQRSARG